MEPNVKRELKVFIPTFAVIILIAIGLYKLMPDQVPGLFKFDGTADAMIPKASVRYHIPIFELAVYVLMTFMQFKYRKTSKSNEQYLFQAKLSIIIFLGLTIPLSSYLYATKDISNIWYIVGPFVAILFIILFILALNTGLLDQKPKKNLVGIHSKRLKKTYKRK